MADRPRCLFINPPMRNGTIYMKEIGRCGRKSIGGEVWPQTGLAYLAAVARDRGCAASIIDAMALGWSWDETLQDVETFRPDLVILLTTTPTFSNDAAFAISLRRKLITPRIGLVGTHVTALPRQALEQSQADYVFMGEAEPVLAQLIDRWDGGTAELPGLAYRRDGKIVIPPRAPVVEPLDSLPDPARDLLPVDRYRMPFTEGQPFATVIPSRGCPYPCTFCRAGDVWGRKVRVRSPYRVVSELVHLRDRHGIRHVTFMTDSLLTNREWALALFDTMVKADLGIEWIGNARVDQVDPEILRLMKLSGCRLMSFGIESGCQELLDAMKKNISLQQSLEGIRMAKQAGITTFAYFIFGMPGETKRTIRETVRFALKLDADYINFHIATPFPGTEFYRQAHDNGWLISNRWEDYEEEGSAAISYPHLSAKDLVTAQRRAMIRVYMAPSRLLRQLRGVRSFSDLKARYRAGLRMFNLLLQSKEQPGHPDG